ncbi:MAG: hypothetical protein AB7G93_03405 [Bdellovibrionales bacterium]
MGREVTQFRHLIHRQLGEFIRKVGFQDAALDQDHTLVDGLLEVADRLKAYQEEGVDLRPEFLIFREADHRELRNTTEVSHFFEICHHRPLSLQTFRDAVKHCAPLAHGVWAAFVKLRGDSLAYGVVRRRNSVIDNRVFARREAKGKAPPPYLRVRQVERHLVEVQGPEECMQITFSVAKEASTDSAHAARSALLDALTRKTFRSKRPPVRAVLEEAFDRALSHGHGFLVGVAPCAGSSLEFPELHKKLLQATQGLYFNRFLIPTQLKVAELVKWRFHGNAEEKMQVLDFLDAQGTSPETLAAFGNRLISQYAEVEAWSELISSLLLADGITLFDDRGSVLGFRIFIQSNEAKQSDGGARLLAFEAMKDLVREKALVAAYYQSQDGRALFYK